MIIRIDKSFVRDVKKVNDPEINKKIVTLILKLEEALNLSDIKNLKKLKGSNDYYRIRMGDFRIGLIISKKEIELIRFLHRKDIYKYFP